ncbi:kelch repeat protein [Grosmannia clavigera kw1407]|uniref:Kelch repeat protein n=1 Tax=Grosmannia clavigera (strain kw1407 / UAMH 11150) TaxID=655863 RepID=F0X921_GROCL|nr:kelch repeat protein [Grosmannia clavigera kw1407]EFX05360.1 kelch repeat protein [Grosmannia clavigera kw1407]
MAKEKKGGKSEGKKAKAAEKKQKAEKKAAKKAKVKNAKQEGSDAEDVDLDAVLEEYKRQQEQFLKITEVVAVEPPRARAAASFLASPGNSNQLLLFGGEYFNGALATFFNDLHVYYIDRDEWRTVTSPNTPLPRSGHAWCRGGNQSGSVFLFGGEFSSPKQGTFYHYNDFWRLDAASREWTRLDSGSGGGGKGKSPPARSGHRMTYYKNYIILFGGFQDTANQTRYLADLWIYDTANFMWHCPTLPPAQLKPDARSSFTLLPHEQGAVLYGGYSRVKTAVGNRQGGGGQRMAMKAVVHQDCFFLRITPPAAGAAPGAPPQVRWERRKKPANTPVPVRAGTTMAFHRGRGILFGGVHDVEESEEGLDSEFFNGLFAWNIERNRFFPMALRKPRTAPKKTAGFGGGADGQRVGRRNRAAANEEELLRQLAALEATDKKKGSGGNEEDDAMDVDGADVAAAAAKAEEEAAVVVRQKPVSMELPHVRFNSLLAVQGDVLYIYGGTYEKDDREFTFDDMYVVDLGKLDGCKEIFSRALDDTWIATGPKKISPSLRKKGKTASEAGSDSTAPSVASTDDMDTETEADTAATSDDGLPYPRPFESRRDFFNRTSNEWQEILMTSLRWKGIQPESLAIKEIKTKAFEMSEEKWWDCREEINALEDEQEAAGIGEVVSLADRAGGGSGGGGGSSGGGAQRRRHTVRHITMPVGIQRLNARKSQPNPHIVFIKPLKGPDEEAARDFLERIAAQCVPIMRENHLSVVTLEEYEPNASFVGRNFNGGEVIQLVLKARFSGRWLPFPYVQMVMMHELAHCRHMNHARAFWAVRDTYAAHMRGLWEQHYTGEGLWGRGARLDDAFGERNTARPDGDDDGVLLEHLCGGTFRSRGRAKKRKPALTYREQQERRIRRKFGENGMSLGGDIAARARLEEKTAKSVAVKPRVAKSKRGRDLRAAAALARFEQNATEKEVKEGEGDDIASIKRDADEESSDDDTKDRDAPDAVDIDGTRMVDGQGRGMVRVCEINGLDDDDDEADTKRELRELLQGSTWERSPKVEEEPEGDKQQQQQQQKQQCRDGQRQTPTVKSEPKQETRERTLMGIPLAPAHAPATITSVCPVCSLANGPLSVTCAMCAHVLLFEADPAAWQCHSAVCSSSADNRYRNAGDCGLCGVCGQRRESKPGG